jgi:hypothetical protein
MFVYETFNNFTSALSVYGMQKLLGRGYKLYGWDLTGDNLQQFEKNV